MILKLIITAILFYYLLLLYWLSKSSNEEKPTNSISKKSESIIGKSTYVAISIDKTVETNNENLMEPMEVDFDIEYEEETEDPTVDLELEEILLQTDEETHLAQGLSFEEMSEAVDVIQEQNVSEEKERKAVQTISKMQQTELFDIMIEQINDGKQRVADMLGKYDANPSEDTSEDLITPKDLEEFNLGSFL